ncbi:MAG: hypothetical protein KAJ48_05660, partial [Elusimicrobiales bacterium]|nr:hypothetical protein [Elusimicrobiales bacterium]
STKKTAPRKLTEKEKKAQHQKWLSSLQPTAEEERARRKKREQKRRTKKKAEKAKKKREEKQWAGRSTANTEKSLGERGNIQTCLSQWRNASLESPSSSFNSEEDCLKALEAAIKTKGSGNNGFNERIETCLNKLKDIGYPLSAKIRNNYIACEKELENAQALASDMDFSETQIDEEKEALKKCLAAFKEEKISLSTSDLTTLDGCERRLAKGRERNEKTRKYKANKAETDRLLNLIEKEREILKRIEFAGQIPLEPFRSDELSRWTGEWNSILSCLDEFKKLGITIPPNSQNRFTDCKKNLWKEQEKIFKAEQIEIDKQQKERWDKQFQEKIAENKRKRLEAEEKQTTEINEDKSKKEKEETSSLSGKVFPANLP